MQYNYKNVEKSHEMIWSLNKNRLEYESNCRTQIWLYIYHEYPILVEFMKGSPP